MITKITNIYENQGKRGLYHSIVTADGQRFNVFTSGLMSGVREGESYDIELVESNGYMNVKSITPTFDINADSRDPADHAVRNAEVTPVAVAGMKLPDRYQYPKTPEEAGKIIKMNCLTNAVNYAGSTACESQKSQEEIVTLAKYFEEEYINA